MEVFGSSSSTPLGAVCTSFFLLRLFGLCSSATRTGTYFRLPDATNCCPNSSAGHCKRLAEDWGKLGTAFKGEEKINVAHIDCTQDKPVCDKFEVSPAPQSDLFCSFLHSRALPG